MKREDRGKSGRENTGVWLTCCLGCRSKTFKLLLDLAVPVVKCAKCGRCYVLIDNHTRLPIASRVVTHCAMDKIEVKCVLCNGTGFYGASKCSKCKGTGRFDLRSEMARREAETKRVKKAMAKNLDPEK